LMCAVGVATLTGCSTNTQKNEDKPEIKEQISEKTGSENKEALGYEDIYLDYIDNNKDYFERGMMLCDLNDDGIPELFSLGDNEEGTIACYHEYTDGKIISPGEESIKTYIDLDSLIKAETFFENTGNFLGVYKNNTTGELAFINSGSDPDGKDIFDIISFENGKLSLKDESIKNLEQSATNPVRKRDEIMVDYAPIDGLYSSYILKGELDGDNPAGDAKEMLEKLIEEFKTGKNVSYGEMKDSEVYCYIKDIDVDNSEIVVVPAEKITYDEYEKAFNSDKIINVNGEDMSIQLDEVLYEEYGIAYLYRMPWFEYQFYVPTEEYPESIIEGYLGNKPVKLKLSDEAKVRYGVLGYDETGEVNGYETLERNEEYSVSEYKAHYAEYSMGSYYKAVIENNEVVCLDVMYHQ